MRTPKPPAGFIPVDSEEARVIGDDRTVNATYASEGVWKYISNNSMSVVRAWHEQDGALLHYHVQLPPAVEWEEVWGWSENGIYLGLYKHGALYKNFERHAWTADHMDTIVAALNEMEVGNG